MATLFDHPPVVATPRPGRHLRGRRPANKMNGTERRYADLLSLRMAAGEVLWWAFDAVKLRLAPSTFYEPDFMVMVSSGDLEIHETKGSHIEDDAIVKLKVAQTLFPLRFFLCMERRKGAGFEVREIDSKA